MAPLSAGQSICSRIRFVAVPGALIVAAAATIAGPRSARADPPGQNAVEVVPSGTRRRTTPIAVDPDWNRVLAHNVLSAGLLYRSFL